MANTLISLIEDVADEVGVERPSSVVGNSDSGARQFLALANRAGKDLAKECDWVVLQRLHSFTTVASTAEYALPSDYDHIIVNTVWDRSEITPMSGPISPQEWQEIKSGLVGNGLYYKRYRVLRSTSAITKKFVVDPTPSTSGDTLVFEYVSNGWVADTGGSTLDDKFTADNDQTLLDRDLLIMGVIWRYLRANGLEYTTALSEYNQRLDQEKARDRPAQVLDVTGRRNIRDYSFPETVST